MAALNINEFEEGNSSLQTETSNSNTPHFTRVARDVVSFCKLRRIVVTFLLALWSTFPVEGEFLCVLEKLLTGRNRNSQKKLHPCESRCLRLKFSHKVAGPVVYTGDCIFPNGTTLELVDVVTGQVVRDVPLVSPQVEIFLLNDDENWTSQELNNHIWMPKRGRKSGRDHNPYLRLEGGVVSVDEIKFKHKSQHKKKLKMVRLGARIVDQPEEIEVKEAMTGSFTVKDKRLKSKKRFPPLPTDDVWRLAKIGRNGAFHQQLTGNDITTVEDFSMKLQKNPQELFQIVGKSMPEKYWEEATAHAKSCNLDGRKYSYHHLETGKDFTVVFNVARQVMWLDSGDGLRHFNMLSESQKVYAHKLVETAFANWKNVEKSDNEISAVDHLPPSGNLVTVGECKLEFQNTSGTTERVEKAECSTSYAIPDCHSEPDEMSLTIKKFMEFVSSDEIQFDDLAYVNSTSAIQFHELQHGEMTQNQFTQFMVSENVTNANEHCKMNNVIMVPEASTTCKSKKSWTKIFSMSKWLELNRSVRLKKVRMTKKRKLNST